MLVWRRDDIWPDLAPPSREFVLRYTPDADVASLRSHPAGGQSPAKPVTLTGGTPVTLDAARSRAVVEGDVARLDLALAVEGHPLVIGLHAEMRAGVPAVRRWTSVTNTGDSPCLVHRLSSAAVSLRPGPGDLELFWIEACTHPTLGPRSPTRWRQATRHTELLGPAARRSIRSDATVALPHDGSSGAMAWLALRDPALDQGLVAGWEWSGSFAADVGDFEEGAGVFGLRLDFGDEGGYARTLAPAATFTTPRVFFGFFKGDVEEAARATRAVAERLYGLPWPEGRPPMFVGYDTWSNWQDLSAAPINHLKPERLDAEIERCRELGVELFILDYDWFKLLGDFASDADRFPDGVEAVARKVKAAGMKFGLWMGFGGGHADSALVREHPEFVAVRNGRPVTGGWGMRSLCFASEPCREYVLEKLCGVVDRFGVDWLKTDFDQITTSNSPAHAPQATDSRIESVEGYYRILEQLHERRPKLYLDNWTPPMAGRRFRQLRAAPLDAPLRRLPRHRHSQRRPRHDASLPAHADPWLHPGLQPGRRAVAFHEPLRRVRRRALFGQRHPPVGRIHDRGDKAGDRALQARPRALPRRRDSQPLPGQAAGSPRLGRTVRLVGAAGPRHGAGVSQPRSAGPGSRASPRPAAGGPLRRGTVRRGHHPAGRWPHARGRGDRGAARRALHGGGPARAPPMNRLPPTVTTWGFRSSYGEPCPESFQQWPPYPELKSFFRQLLTCPVSTAATRFMPTAFAGVGLLITAQFAATAAPPDPARAAQLDAQADATVTQAEKMEADAEKAPEGYPADDYKKVATATRQTADALRMQATAVSAGNDEDIAAAAARLQAALTQQKMLSQQAGVLSEVYYLALQEGPARDKLKTATPEANKPLLDALLAAYTGGVEAGENLRAVLTPDTEPVDIEAARDAFIRAKSEVDVARYTLNFANERASWASKPGADRAAAAAKLVEIETLGKEWLMDRKAELAAALQRRGLERSRNAAYVEFEKLRTQPNP